MNRKESKRRQNVTHVVLLFVTVVIYRTHLKPTQKGETDIRSLTVASVCLPFFALCNSATVCVTPPQ